MAIMTSTLPAVIAGVDTHADTHHAAVVTTTGARLGDAQFPTTVDGYRRLAAFIAGFGEVQRVGVEGTNSYGAGLSRHLRHAGVEVVEVIRPARAVRRRRGKSDAIDAYAAAGAALSGQDLPIPKDADGDVEAIRALHAARRSAVKARSGAIRQVKSLLVTAPEAVRARFSGLSNQTLVGRLAAARPGPADVGTGNATLHALRHLARRHQYLGEEIALLEADLRTLVLRAAPALYAAKGVGVVTAAQLLVTVGDNPERLRNEACFAALCGVAPVPASSGKTTRHRLCRGGDRHANAAVHQIVLARMSCDPRTKAYIAKRTAQGKDTRDIMRCLKRAVAREVFRLIVNPPAVPTIEDLRPLRLARAITLQQAANHLDAWPARISELERGQTRDDDLAHHYRQWLLHA